MAQWRAAGFAGRRSVRELLGGRAAEIPRQIRDTAGRGNWSRAYSVMTSPLPVAASVEGVWIADIDGLRYLTGWLGGQPLAIASRAPLAAVMPVDTVTPC